MWRINDPKLEIVTLNFTSSEQGYLKVTRLISEGVEIFNALELTDWDDEIVQVSICNHCGNVGCSSGSWVALRFSGDFVLLMPAFEAMSKDDWSRDEFSPPYFIEDKGTAYFDIQTYESLREKCSLFPPINKIQPLQMFEAMWLVQYAAPLQILGKPTSLEIDHRKFDIVISAINGNPKEYLKQAENLLHENLTNQAAANLRPLLLNEESVWLFLETTEFIDWRIMTISNGKYRFVLDNELVLSESPNI